MQLQGAKARFEKQGIKLAAVSYDSVEILRSFADRKHIDFPLLADPDSKIIREYGVLNEQASGMQKGMARPGYFYVDAKGVIREKFFEDKYQERFSPNNVIGKLFPELGEEVSNTTEAPHLRVVLEQSDRVVAPGSRVTLVARVELPKDVHVYSPGVQGYKPIQLILDSALGFEAVPAHYPRSKILYLPAIQERVPVFEGAFEIEQDVKVSSAEAFSASLGENGKTVTVSGRLNYQACDTKICYLPDSVPVKWELQVLPLDRQRAPEEIRHK